MIKYLRIMAVVISIVFFVPGCSSPQKAGDNGIKDNIEVENESGTEEDPTGAVGTEPQEKPLVKPEKNPGFTKESFLRIDGSTATIPLSEGIGAELLKMDRVDVKRFIRHNTTHNAYVNLIERKADIIFVTEPSKEELELARKGSVEMEVVPVVKDAFVFLVNVDNPVESLKLKKIQEIYQGKIKNWKEVGGRDMEIIAYQRPKNSGSQTIMENLVMKGLDMAQAPTELKPEAMEGLIERVAGYDNSEKALGYSVYYYANTMYVKDTVKLIGVDGVKPDRETIMSGRYPLASAYYAVLRKDDASDSPARRLLEWLLSEEGQKVAEKSGYIPVQ